MVQWLRFHTPSAGPQVQFLAGELRSCILQGTAKKQNRAKNPTLQGQILLFHTFWKKGEEKTLVVKRRKKKNVEGCLWKQNNFVFQAPKHHAGNVPISSLFYWWLYSCEPSNSCRKTACEIQGSHKIWNVDMCLRALKYGPIWLELLSKLNMLYYQAWFYQELSATFTSELDSLSVP